MQRGTGNFYLPTGNGVSGSLSQSNIIPINVTPSHGTHTPYGQGSEQRTSQPINLSLPARVSLNLETGADRASAALVSSNSRSVGSIIGLNASHTVVSDGHGQDIGSTSAGNNSLRNQVCSCGRIINVLHSGNAPYSNQVEYCNCRETPRIDSSSGSSDLPEFINATLPNEGTSSLVPIGTMAHAAHSSRMIIFRRAEPDVIVMPPNILGNNYFSDGVPTIFLANGISIYHAPIIPRNPFSYWIPAGILTFTLAPVLPVMHAPSFSIPWSHVSWNWTYSSISFHVPSMYHVNGTIGSEVIPHQTFVPTYQFPHISPVPGAERIITRENMVYTNFPVQQANFPMNQTPRFTGVNHGPLTPLHPYNFYMAQNAIPPTFYVDVENMSYEGLLAFQAQVGHVSTGLSREVIVAHMKCIKYELTERSENDNDICCICLYDFSDGQLIGSTDCCHSYHFDCISKWLMEKNICPLCKRSALTI
ncbi:hypothetical protein K7X08_019481 [Anisodus acutangulus]|uniref:RING-type E3 ubiquitin transferase n=1 Tax=Anisodus acutangulus TaxID=402998 RepID=A0A9Q1MVA7_9SOLA|nr:hypothetical protein K7X08_019481 [Anisodus acutangulus]